MRSMLKLWVLIYADTGPRGNSEALWLRWRTITSSAGRSTSSPGARVQHSRRHHHAGRAAELPPSFVPERGQGGEADRRAPLRPPTHGHHGVGPALSRRDRAEGGGARVVQEDRAVHPPE